METDLRPNLAGTYHSKIRMTQVPGHCEDMELPTQPAFSLPKDVYRPRHFHVPEKKHETEVVLSFPDV